MLRHEPRHRPRRHIHHGACDDNSGDHDLEILRHPDRSDDGIQREHQIDDDDLDDDPEERAGFGLRRIPSAFARFDLAVNLVRRLGDQECTAADQDDVAPRKPDAIDGEHRLRQSDQPHQQAEQQDTKHQRKRQSDLPRAFRLPRRNARHDHREEDDVVDAEHDLERRQGQQRRPRFGAGQ